MYLYIYIYIPVHGEVGMAIYMAKVYHLFMYLYTFIQTQGSTMTMRWHMFITAYMALQIVVANGVMLLFLRHLTGAKVVKSIVPRKPGGRRDKSGEHMFRTRLTCTYMYMYI